MLSCPFRLAAKAISGCLALVGSFVWSGAKETLCFLPDWTGVAAGGKDACCLAAAFLATGTAGGVGALGAFFLATFGAGLTTGAVIACCAGGCSFFGVLAVVTGLSGATFAGGATLAAGGGLFLAGATAATLTGVTGFAAALLGAALDFAGFFACTTGAPLAAGTCSMDLGAWSPGSKSLRLNKLGRTPLPELAGWL